LAFLTFCVALVVQRDGALDCDMDTGAATLSLSGSCPTNSAVLYQLQAKHRCQDLPLGTSKSSMLSPVINSST
jgi:hypothetical protein